MLLELQYTKTYNWYVSDIIIVTMFVMSPRCIWNKYTAAAFHDKKSSRFCSLNKLAIIVTRASRCTFFEFHFTVIYLWRYIAKGIVNILARGQEVTKW